MTSPHTRSILAAFATQIGWCESLGSPLTAQVLAVIAEDIASGGIAAPLVADWPGDPLADALALRFAGALHALVLSQASPALAACYPPHTASQASLRAAVPAALETHAPFIKAFLASPPQTNEVGRSGVLLGGFGRIAQAAGLPLRLLEIGASAGLNAVWDRYRYRLGEAEWGDPASPVLLAPAWSGPAPQLGAPLKVAARAACDIAPVDLDDPEARLRLRAFVWADQSERLARLEAAIAVARSADVKVEQADAGDWLEAQLRRPSPGCVTVLYHSIMWSYLPAATQGRIDTLMQAHGAEANDASPLAWLRFEGAQPKARPELRLTLWPGGREERLAVAHPHGAEVEWLAQTG